MRIAALGAIAMLLALGPAVAGERAPVVVELFTSQGCSSCPPADDYLADLAKREDVLALGWHVDYWNYIGWTDPFAAKWATQRQRDYERSLNQRYVYTPEIVVGGAAHHIGSEREAVDGMIAAQPGGVVAVAVERSGAGGVLVRIGKGDGPPATVWLIRFDREHVTRVARGENGGRTLRNANVVRDFEEIGVWRGDPLEITVGADRLAGPGDGGCAVLVQAGGAGPILGAAKLVYAATN
jgi:hypothetical protein